MRKFHYYCLMAVLLNAACITKVEAPKKTESPTPNQQNTSAQPTPIAQETERSVSEVINQLPLLDKDKKLVLLRTWRQVPNHEDYRAVRPSDFRIPHWVEKEYYWSDIAHSTGWASDYGEMGGAYGLIIFIVNKTATAVNHFSVVVFIERPRNRYSVHWIFRDQDLSRVNLRRHSGDVYLEEFRDDGTTHTCDVQWNRKLARWSCDLN